MPLTIREVKIYDLNNFTLAEGKQLQIRSGVPIEELLNLAVPEGESWEIEIHLRIEISD